MLETGVIHTRLEGSVLYATLNNPPLNLVDPALGRDLVSIIRYLDDNSEEIRVAVFASALPEYFSAHFDLEQTAAFNKEMEELSEGASIVTLYERISALKQVTIAVIEGRAGGAGSELALACDMRFASRERALFTQMEVGMGVFQGGGGLQRLTRLLGRGRAYEVILGSDTFDADIAERYGWINRAMPEAELMPYVTRLAQRIASFAQYNIHSAKERIDALTHAPEDEALKDLEVFREALKTDETKGRIKTLLDRGLQTDGDAERAIGKTIGELPAEQAATA